MKFGFNKDTAIVVLSAVAISTSVSLGAVFNNLSNMKDRNAVLEKSVITLAEKKRDIERANANLVSTIRKCSANLNSMQLKDIRKARDIVKMQMQLEFLQKKYKALHDFLQDKEESDAKNKKDA